MKANKKIYNSLKYMSMISQLGISVIAPAIVCIWGAIWLKSKFNLGDWVVLVGIFLGLASGICSFINYMKMFLRDVEKEQKEYENKFKF